MEQKDLIPHLFRTEFRKITTVLCKVFGIAHIEIAEDIASDTFLTALETWSFKGIPENPTAWLYTVAKNKTRNYLLRNKIFSEKIALSLTSQPNLHTEPEIDLSDKNINDSQLQMMFAVCHPSLSTEAQIGLSLRILCGFGIEEIADALLTGKETINKRLFRAKEKLRLEKVAIEFPPEKELSNRLENVLTTIYLLFNEGYYSESHDEVLREDLCAEAMHLVYLLIQNERTNQPKVNALYALMCFHSSRFPARRSNSGEIPLYDQQDRSLWDFELIARGAYYLKEASKGAELSKYHLEACIAYWHTVKSDTGEKWENILQLYNQLLQLEYSPIAALNRTFALSKVYGSKKAIAEAEKLQLTGNQYYYTLLGELYSQINDDKSRENFQKALLLATTAHDKKTISDKLKRYE
jgi:RNA polymerase sigma factor (sigma-70 family)